MIIALDGFKKKEVRICNNSRYLNTLILGQKGTGKSDHVLLNMFYQDLKAKDHSVFVFTSKGDTAYKLYTLAKHMGRKVHIVKPETNTFHINLLKGEEDEVLEDMIQLFRHSLQMEGKGEQFYEQINSTLLINSLKVVKRLLGDKGTIEDVYDLMANVNGTGKRNILEFSRLRNENESKAKENKMIASWFLNEYFSENRGAKLFDYCIGIRMKMRELVDSQNVYQLSPLEEELPDWKKVVKNKEIVIVDTEFLNYKEYADFMGTYLLSKIKRELLESEIADSFLYIDDFQRYYPVLTELIEGSHIKNVGITLFLQDTNQLDMYPKYKQVIMNSVSNLILLERISVEDYQLYKEHVNAELLNRKRGEIVYKIINREGTSESTNGTIYALERLMLDYERYLDVKKQLIRKKRKKPVERKEEKVEEVVTKDKAMVEDTKEEIIEGDTSKKVKTFEQTKRERDGKEYLSADEVFSDDE